jgi:hypothetical protein
LEGSTFATVGFSLLFAGLVVVFILGIALAALGELDTIQNHKQVERLACLEVGGCNQTRVVTECYQLLAGGLWECQLKNCNEYVCTYSSIHFEPR